MNQQGGLDSATLLVGAAVGGGVGTLAAILIIALIARFVYRSWFELDNLRTLALVEIRAQNADLRRRIEDLERRTVATSKPRGGTDD